MATPQSAHSRPRAPKSRPQETRAAPPRVPQTIAVVITTYNDTAFLREALASVMDQTRPADEIIVVDDGSPDDPRFVVAEFPAARLIRQHNQGLAAARNTGLLAASTDAVVFLDADDRLETRALELGLTALEHAPKAAFAFGGYRMIQADGGRLAERPAPSGLSYRDLLLSNRIGMHATVTYRRPALLAIRGFDPAMARCEDYDVYLRIARDSEIVSFPAVVAEYRRHEGNMSHKVGEMLAYALRALDHQWEHVRGNVDLSAVWRSGRQNWTGYYESMLPRPFADRLRQKIKKLLPRALRDFVFGYRAPRAWPAWGDTCFGDLDRTQPICDDFGYGRGTPVDRGYVEAFLDRFEDDIAGRVLEVADDTYCRRFGGVRVTRQEVLHVKADAPGATIIGDLSSEGTLPRGAIDCMVVTQTLQFIYDMAGAVREMHRGLKPGGVALITVPGITRIDRGEWGSSWFWSLTEVSARRLFEDVFGPENVEVVVYGNVFAATAFLHGLALEELDKKKLAETDPCFPVIIGVRAKKAAGK